MEKRKISPVCEVGGGGGGGRRHEVEYIYVMNINFNTPYLRYLSFPCARIIILQFDPVFVPTLISITFKKTNITIFATGIIITHTHTN